MSIQLDGAKGFYLRHQRGVLYLHKQPPLNTLFEEDASFKLVHLDGDKVRFESCNFPGTFITARDDGSVVVIRDPLPAQSIFVLKAESTDVAAGQPESAKLETALVATKNAPFVNTLGMKFVPVQIVSGPTAGQKVFFSVWDTRVQDYAAYAGAKKVDDSWTKQERDGVPAGRELNHPVVGVSWEDAQGFCQWLTEKETTEGKLPKGVKYRLPTDEEWSWAVELPPELGATPAKKSGENSVDFPWGKDWPPTKKVGNYGDETFHAKFPKTAHDKNKDQPWIEGYTDGYATTSPVGSFPANAYGLYDMGGNVWQWCEDWFDASHKGRVVRGACWDNPDRDRLLSSTRHCPRGGPRQSYFGFRCVVGPFTPVQATTFPATPPPPKPANPKIAATAPATPAPATPATPRAAGDAGGIVLAQTPPAVQKTVQANIGNGKVTSISKGDESATFRFEKPAAPSEPPVSGKETRDSVLFDAVMLKYMKKIGCTAAELAITRKGVLVESRGYGWSDRRATVPMRPDNPMAIGSVEKTLIEACIKQLARAGKLDLNASVFKLLKIEPHGKVVDPRIWDITLNHMLEHKSGLQGEPLDRSEEEYRAKGRGALDASAPWVASRDNDTEKRLGFVMVQKLIDAPGTKANYCNFGYDVLRLVIAETTGHPCSDYIRHELFRPFGMAEIKEMQAPGVQVKGEPPQVWNALSVDFDTYPVQPCSPVRASAPALCTFMKHFWIDGEPRNHTNWYFTFDGSTDNTLSHICQRAGEKFGDLDFAFIFNGRTEGVGTGEIEAELKQIIKKSPVFR